MPFCSCLEGLRQANIHIACFRKTSTFQIFPPKDFHPNEPFHCRDVYKSSFFTFKSESKPLLLFEFDSNTYYIPNFKSKTKNDLTTKSQMEYCPYPTNTALKWLDYQIRIESRPRLGYGFGFQTIRTPLLLAGQNLQTDHTSQNARHSLFKMSKIQEVISLAVILSLVYRDETVHFLGCLLIVILFQIFKFKNNYTLKATVFFYFVTS